MQTEAMIGQAMATNQDATLLHAYKCLLRLLQIKLSTENRRPICDLVRDTARFMASVLAVGRDLVFTIPIRSSVY